MSKDKRNEQQSKCSVPVDDCVFSKRCFMTGEYCSKQRIVQRERRLLHSNEHFDGDELLHEDMNGNNSAQVNAFVVMNFSSMSDVIFKWRIRPFIEKLKEYLYIENEKLCCSAVPVLDDMDRSKRRVSKVNVVRADTNPSSNFVICSRICQQMQIADIVIVDVSDENANVFYELGLAVALGKLILPICYSESYFKEVLPDKLKKEMEDNENIILRHHIDCFPWRRKLYEHFRILFRNNYNVEPIKKWKTEYMAFDDVTKSCHGFSDRKWVTFPYHEDYENGAKPVKTVGRIIYEHLAESYNQFAWEDNTLIVYTIDSILNPTQAGSCIIHFYKNVVAKYQNERCFCGDRIGVLIQPNTISEETKDAAFRRKVPYSIGDIVLTGVNQASYKTSQETIKPHDYLQIEHFENTEIYRNSSLAYTNSWKETLLRFSKNYFRNRGLPVYPEMPIHVDQLLTGIQHNIFADRNSNSFSFFDTVLQTLKYTDEIVVDISNNTIQSLFWLGVAHGSGISAVTVKFSPSPNELRDQIEEAEEISSGLIRKDRNIFDVAGLWTAVLFSNRTDLFYQQLVDVQRGIEICKRRLVPEIDNYESSLENSFLAMNMELAKKGFSEMYSHKSSREKKLLEAYYRANFWSRMLAYNSLQIYAPLSINKVYAEDEQSVPLWDVNALSRISNYLSKRKTIGEYTIKAKKQIIAENDEYVSGKTNYLCIGKTGPNSSKPLGQFIGELSGTDKHDLIFAYDTQAVEISKAKGLCCDVGSSRRYRGFEKGGLHYVSQVPVLNCYSCSKLEEHEDRVIGIKCVESIESLADERCEFSSISKKLCDHSELGQIVLWRQEKDGHQCFRAVVTGASGPATYAVSSILTDLEQKKDIFDKDADSFAFFPFSVIQEKANHIFLSKYKDSLRTVLKQLFTDDSTKERDQKYCELVITVAIHYLASTLSQYYFPFFTNEDIATMVNGMQTYINAMQAAAVSPFDLDYSNSSFRQMFGDTKKEPVAPEKVLEAEKATVNTLNHCLSAFIGIEVLFDVTVGSEDDPNQTSSPNNSTAKIRKVKDMKLYTVGDDGINCICREEKNELLNP